MNIAIISAPDRRRENLVSMLESIAYDLKIKVFDSSQDAIDSIDSLEPVTLFVDYRDPNNLSEKEIGSLIFKEPVNYVVLLVSRNGSDSHFTHFSSCELIYDEVTIDMLSNLLKNVQIKTY